MEYIKDCTYNHQSIMKLGWSARMVALSLVIIRTGGSNTSGRLLLRVQQQQRHIRTQTTVMSTTAFITKSPSLGKCTTSFKKINYNKRISPYTTLSEATDAAMSLLHQLIRRFSIRNRKDIDCTDNDGSDNSKRSLQSPALFASRLQSSTTTPSGITRRGRNSMNNMNRDTDAFQDGLYVLGQSEMEQNDDDPDRDKEFDLFDRIPPKQIEFRTGLPIMVEVLSFGPLGASVAVIGKGHKVTRDTPLVDSSTPYALGLIYQNEIAIFRELRSNIDVVIGEVLPAYVERVREHDSKIDVSLRVIGGRAKVDKWSSTVLERLHQYENGELPLGNKSSPKEIAQVFPGMSKVDFKKCVGALFERQLVYPFAYCTKRYEDGLVIARAQKAAKLIETDSDTTDSSTTDSISSPPKTMTSPTGSNVGRRENANYRRGSGVGNRSYNPKNYPPVRRRRDDFDEKSSKPVEDYTSTNDDNIDDNYDSVRTNHDVDVK